MTPRLTDDAGLSLKDRAADWKWKGTWNEFLGRAKQLWGNAISRDLDDVNEGQYQEALGRLQRTTGEAMDDIRRKFS